MKTTLLTLIMFVSMEAYAIDCHTNCDRVAEFRYPCPTFSNPGRTCRGVDPATRAACLVTKKAACVTLKKLLAARGRNFNPASAEAKKFITCMGFPNPGEAAACLAAIPGCFVTAVGGPIPYGACLGAACGTAGAKHSYRCAKQSKLLPKGVQ